MDRDWPTNDRLPRRDRGAVADSVHDIWSHRRESFLHWPVEHLAWDPPEFYQNSTLINWVGLRKNHGTYWNIYWKPCFVYIGFNGFFFPLNLEDLMPKVKGPRQSRDALYEETHPVVCIVIEILHYVHSQIFNQMDVQAPQSMDRSPYQWLICTHINEKWWIHDFINNG